MYIPHTPLRGTPPALLSSDAKSHAIKGIIFFNYRSVFFGGLFRRLLAGLAGRCSSGGSLTTCRHRNFQCSRFELVTNWFPPGCPSEWPVAAAAATAAGSCFSAFGCPHQRGRYLDASLLLLFRSLLFARRRGWLCIGWLPRRLAYLLLAVPCHGWREEKLAFRWC